MDGIFTLLQILPKQNLQVSENHLHIRLIRLLVVCSLKDTFLSRVFCLKYIITPSTHAN